MYQLDTNNLCFPSPLLYESILMSYQLLKVGYGSCCSLNVCVPFPNSYVEILMLNVMGLEGRGFGRCLSHEDGALRNGISVFIQESHRNPSTFYHIRTWWEVNSLQLKEELCHNPTMLSPWIWTSRLQNYKR